MLSKLIAKDARGLSFGVFSLFGTLGLIMINKVGGITYEYNEMWPFIISLIVYFLFTLATIAAGLANKIKV